MSDLVVVARVAWANYRVTATAWAVVTVLLPRAVLQVAFLTMLGQHITGHENGAYALLASSAYVATRSTIINLLNVVTVDLTHGTLDGTRLGRRHLATVLITRSWVWVVEGATSATTAFATVGLLLLGPSELAKYLDGVVLVAVAAATTVPIGLLTATFALRCRAEALVSNVAAYALLLLCGAMARPTGVWAEIADTLPLTNLITALHGVVDGRWDWLLLGREAVADATWLLIAIFAIQHVARRLRKTGPVT
jgi:ABC-2 type transport system permease protein